ncbi:glycosyl hydrolase family 18 protein [Synechococcus sp. MVIR-18-1]|uniref:glycosyl hydrolase family 18 protein n=1 Tax=Synechococcus sp. MVIR-18-1 TaxID=1386941 RepID=UPI001643FFDA|nr:glycosyl hydrolase family 18 protein [Synechococcus sp. MVIR-18-1]
MTDSFANGVTYQVNPAGSDITDFNSTTDSLDFGEISVHGLILGALPDGTAAIVNPWADQVQALQGLSWSDLSLNNLGVVGNEHLRQDIGAVLSWEQAIGARDSETVYIRSHQFGVQEVIDDFDPQTQKLNFLYTGTRERLSVVDTDQGLLIQFEPTNQSVLLKGVQRSELIGANLEFHHDQVMEDNLEVPFGFTAEEVSLVSRAGLLTPQAPSGASTDGDQMRAGLMVNPDSTVIAMDAFQSMTDHSMHNHPMPSSSGELQASVAGKLYSGGMGGTLTLSNASDVALNDWSFRFLTNQPDFESWSAESSVNDLGGGVYQVLIKPPAWGLEIPAGGSVDLSFNANSVGLPDSGELSNALFFVAAPGADVAAPDQADLNDTSSLSTVDSPPIVEPSPAVEPSPVMADSQGLSVSATITDGWSGIFAGEITVTNVGDGSAGNDWSVDVVMDAPLTMVSNFEVTSSLRGDGRYDVSISPKAWAAPLAPGASQASYYQAAGEFIDPAQVFDFTESVVVAESPASTPMVEPSVEPTVEDTVATSVDVPVPNGGSDKRIVTYFEEWGVYERDINLSDVNGQAMTHLNYSFFDVKADGSVQLFDAYAAQEKRFDAADQVSRTFTTAEYQAVDPALIAAYNSDRYTITETADSVTITSVPVGWNDAGPQDAGNFEQLSRFKELNPNVELGFALGGWTLSDEFSTAFTTQAGRDQFTSDVVDIFKTYEFFSVVDFDWEYPGGGGDAGNASSANDGANFALVLEQLRSELDALESQTGGNYEVSIATAGGSEKLANLNLAGIDPYVDFYNVMTYDFHGGWESQTGHQAAMTGDANNYDVTTSVSVFEEAGVALNKVVLGAPAYTRAWGGVEAGGTFGYQQSGTGAEAQGSFEAGVYDYKDIVTDVITGQTDLYWDDNSKAAFAYNGDEWSSIETTATIAGKAAYVQEKDLGGMMFWALSNDAEGDLSLVEAADDILRQGGSYSEAIGNAPEFDTILGGNGEFSISDFTALA